VRKREERVRGEGRVEEEASDAEEIFPVIFNRLLPSSINSLLCSIFYTLFHLYDVTESASIETRKR